MRYVINSVMETARAVIGSVGNAHSDNAGKIPVDAKLLWELSQALKEYDGEKTWQAYMKKVAAREDVPLTNLNAVMKLRLIAEAVSQLRIIAELPDSESVSIHARFLERVADLLETYQAKSQ